MNRHPGSIAVRKLRLHRIFNDLYLSFLTARWSTLVLVVALGYGGLNLLFAELYLLGGDVIQNARPGNFEDAFFFSVQTMATVGYGSLHPRGLYANCLAAIESFQGLLGFAMASALMFAKFSRPTAKMLFSKVMVVGMRNGKRCLMFRIANTRDSQLMDAQLSVVLIRASTTLEGENYRQFLDVPLQRSRSPFFAMTWTGVHAIDEKSPLYGDTAETLERDDAYFFITIIGIEGAFSETVHLRNQYTWRDLHWNHQFVDILSFDEKNKAHINFLKFHDTRPEATA